MNSTEMMLELAELHSCKSPFTAKTIKSPQICTARDGAHCQVSGEISVWNEFLAAARLELRLHSPRQLCLAPLDNVGWEPDEEQKQHAATLVCLLLRYHHCVASFQIESWYALYEYEPLIGPSLRTSPELRSLRLLSSHVLTYRLLEDLAPVIPYLSQLEELECNISSLPDGVIQPLCLLVAKSPSLKTLSMPTCFMDPLEGQRFRGALVKNAGLTRLVLNSSCLVQDAPGQETFLAKYLENNKTLVTLGIYCDASWRFRELQYVLESLTHNKTITSFSLRSFFVDNNSALVIEKFLVGTSTLKKFEMEYCAWYEFGAMLSQPLYDTDDFGTKSERICPWLSVLKNNRSLEELTLNLSGFCPAECKAFFEELALNTNLKRVVIEDLGCYCSRRHRATWENSCMHDDRKKFLYSRQDLVMTKCKQLRKIGFSLDNPQDVHWFIVALPAVLSTDCMTTVEFDLAPDVMEDLVGSLIGGYIEKTKVLGHLTLGFHASPNAVTPTALVCRKTILNALSKNTTIRRLFLQCDSFTEEETDLLATITRLSKSINELKVNTDAASVEALLTVLFPRFSENYTLLSAHFYVKQMPLTREYCAVKEVVRRNRDLVIRAAHYVAGGDRSGHCAVAVELVGSNPALVEEVCRLATVDENLALRMIRDSSRSLQTMHGFMRAVGVVSKRVVCHRVSDCSVQLSDLDDWSWFSIRRHLNVADVFYTETRDELN